MAPPGLWRGRRAKSTSTRSAAAPRPAHDENDAVAITVGDAQVGLTARNCARSA